MPEPLSFGAMLKAYRKARDLTQEKLAEEAGCAPDTLRKIEADRLRPSLELSEKLAQALRVPEDERETFIRRARQLPEEHALPDWVRQQKRGATHEVARLLGFGQDVVIRPPELLLTGAAYVLGRDPTADVVIEAYVARGNGEKGNVVSRRHARIERDGPRFLLRDTESLNGTFVNRQKIEGPHLLVHDDQIGLGLAEPMLIFFDPDPTTRSA